MGFFCVLLDSPVRIKYSLCVSVLVLLIYFNLAVLERLGGRLKWRVRE